MGRLILVLGGARSGKSDFAQRTAASSGEPVLFVATAAASDDEMRERIARHREARPAGWETREEPRQVSRAIAEADASFSVILVDCITLMVSNLILDQGVDDPTPSVQSSAEAVVMREVEAILQASRQSLPEVILVSNEVGHGVVPASALGRVFRDIAGRVNQRLAREADQVFFLVAGLPQRLK